DRLFAEDDQQRLLALDELQQRPRRNQRFDHTVRLHVQGAIRPHHQRGAQLPLAARRSHRGDDDTLSDAAFLHAQRHLERYGIAGTVPTLLVIISVSFCVVRLAPGGPFAQEQALPPPVRANLERLYGLDEPLTVQYAHYLRGLLRGDFGPSLRQRDFTVSELIAQGLPLSATLGLAAILLAVLTGVPAGVLAALWRNRAADYCITTLAAVALALPSFVTGPLFALLFGLYLRWLPVAGWQHGAPRYLVLPVLTLALPVAAYLARLTRASLLEVLAAHYVLSARARGLGAARVLWSHAMRP